MAKHRSKIFEIINDYSEASFEYDPISATMSGRTEYNHLWNDYSYQEVDPFLKTVKQTLKKLKAEESTDRYDEIAKMVVIDDLERYIVDTDIEYFYAYWGGHFNPLSDIFEVFQYMPKETKEDIANITKRMQKIPTVITEWISSLKDVANLGFVNAKFRVETAIKAIENFADGKFTKFAESVDKDNKKLMRAAKDAEIAYEQAVSWLYYKYLPICSDRYAVGEERYLKDVKGYTGLDINPKEIYEWGLKETEAINQEMWKIANEVLPEAKSLIELSEYFNNDPKYKINSLDEFVKFSNDLSDNAAKELNGTIFSIDPKIKYCRVKLNEDTLDPSPYYQPPSDDLSRPGYGIIPVIGQNEFVTWDKVSTWYHETIPGHHLQIATTVLKKDTLTAYQRGEGWNSGYGEGWALYSERLMDELGYFKDPGYRLGYLICQAMRSTRLVVDIGLHLEYDDPDGNPWTPESAAQYMVDKALLDKDYAKSEIERYISWSGQAISYKLGEKVWLEIREDAKQRLGDKFDIKKFHNHALKLGPMGLDRLKNQMSKWNGR